MNLLQRDVVRNDTDCPGDTIHYQCSVMSNSETVQLTWRVTLPGMMPVNITYDSTSLPNTVDTDFGYNITTILTDFIPDMYIESTIVFTVLSDVDLNQTLLECISEHLDESLDRVLVNIAGILILVFLD